MTETTPGGKIIVPLVVLAAVIAVAWVWMGKPNTSSVPDLTEAAISSAARAAESRTATARADAGSAWVALSRTSSAVNWSTTGVSNVRGSSER